MSFEATRWAWTTPAEGFDLLVLLVLADRADRRGLAWPALADIADQAGVSVRATRRSLRWLEDAGVVSTAVSKGGRRQRSHYTLALRFDWSGSTNTRPEGPGKTEAKPGHRDRVTTSDTRPEGPGLANQYPATDVTDTRPQMSLNPASVAGVVLRTKPSKEPVREVRVAHARVPATQAHAHAREAPDSSEPVVSGPCAATALHLVSNIIPTTHPRTVRTQLAEHARRLLADEIPADVIADALRLWLDRADASPGLLPHLVSDVLRRRNGTGTLTRRSTTDDRVAAALALGREYDTAQPPALRAIPGGAT